MSRPYPQNVTSNQAPFNRQFQKGPPNSNASTLGGGPPTSFKTNVNRAKTKRWVEAKSYSYDGDDWGDVDDYDEYGGYDEPAPQAKPTGLRQQGQTASSGAAGDYNIGGRSNSFSRGDERRDFSAGALQHGNQSANDGSWDQSISQQGGASTEPIVQDRSPQAHSQYQQSYQSGSLASSIGGRPSMDVQSSTLDKTNQQSQGNYRGVPYTDQPRQLDPSARSQSITSSNSSVDFHSRRDFSPSAMPPPLSTRASPAPRTSADFIPPPRKSSLSQQGHSLSSGPDEAASSNPSLSEARNRTDTNPSKPLPFVRPADIYRRMQEEKARERQSQESSRPSMEAITSGQGMDGSGSDQPGERANTENLSGLPPRLRTSSDADDEIGGRRLKPSLDPVVERKSEYGTEGLGGRQFLPDVARVSGFGESFLGQLGHDNEHTLLEPSSTSAPGEDTSGTDLQHRPSQGFRSVVNQAFDRSDDIPATPSISGSAVARSNSESTNALSPIISRAPSAVKSDVKAREAEARVENIPIIAEESGGNTSRPASSDAPATPRAAVRKTPHTQSSRSGSSSSIPIFIPGHRRDISTPSPENSPARTPVLEANRQLRHPQEIEYAMTTPTEPNMPESGQSSSHETDASPIATTGITTLPSMRQGSKISGINTNVAPTSSLNNQSPKRLGSPIGMDLSLERVDSRSPSKSRVRDLAGKFDAVSLSRRGSEQSLPTQNNIPGPIVSKMEDPSISRPGNDRMQSFRPHLPGGWESSTSIPPAKQDRILEISNRDEVATLEEPGVDHNMRTGVPRTENDSATNINITPTNAKRTPSVSPEKNATENPFSAVTAAGAALAESLVAAVGLNHAKASSEPEELNTARDRSASIRDREVHPEASKMWASPTNHSESSIVPTPLAHDNVQNLDQSPVSNSDYFPPVVPLKQKPRNIITGDDESTPPTRPQILPSLSTDPSPHDYESDRLRKELVRELSPHAENYEMDDGSIQSFSAAGAERLAVNTSSRSQAHDSIGLPREYESYWNGSASEEDLSRPTSEQQLEPFESSRGLEQPANENAVTQIGEIHERDEGQLNSSPAVQVRPTELTHRFSWEPEPEQVNTVQQPSSIGSSLGIQSDHQLSHILQSLPSQATQSVGMPTTQKESAQEAVGIDGTYESDIGAPGSPSVPRARPGNDDPVSLEPQSDAVENRLSGSTQQSPQGGDAEDRGKAKDFTEEPELPLPPLPAEQPKIPAFREILALKSPSDRIKAYEATRHQFADMNTGLAHWIAATVNDLPEHAALLTNGGQFTVGASSHKPSPSRGKLAGLRLSSVQPLQQPYYQQYLNASSQPIASSSNSTAQTSSANAPVSNYSSSGATGSRHQVQAKGKDFLHSAGKFGGKANVAAKGLFSKSKSKLRGAGGGDKASIWSSTKNDSSRRGMQPEPQSQLSELENNATTSNTSIDNTILTTTYATSCRPVSCTPSASEGPLTQNEYDSVLRSKEDVHLWTEDDTVKNQLNTTEQNAKTSVPYETWDELVSTNDPPKLSPVMIRDSAPIFLKHTATAQSYEESPRALQSALSTNNGNQTPTQTTLAKSQWLSEIMPTPNISQHRNEQPTGPPEPQQKDHSARGLLSNAKLDSHNGTLKGQSESKDELEAPDSRSITQDGKEEPPQRLSHDIHPATKVYRGEDWRGSTNPRNISDKTSSSRASEDSEGTFKTADSGEGSGTRDPGQMSTSGLKQPAQATQDDPILESSNRHATPNNSQHQLDERSDSLLTPKQGRPFSFIENNRRHSGKPSEDVSYRSSIDTPVQENHGRPRSPVSPQRSDIIQSTQENPVHHDINHDFNALDDNESSKQPRPRSFSRPFQDPDLQNHPAFRHEDHEMNSSDLPAQYYPAQLSQNETMLARQQTTEYQLEGVGPPHVDEPTATPRSRRGSRSSAFFKRLSGPPKAEVSPLPTGVEQQNAQSTNPPNVQVGKNTRRASLFRTLTGHADSNSSQSKERVPSVPSRSHMDPYQPKSNRTSRRADSSTGVSAKSDNPASTRNKLQRSSTSGVAGQDGAKKKRFSAIGSIFGRSKQRQSSVPMPAQQSTYPASHAQQLEPYYQQRPLPGSAYYANHQASGIPLPTHSQSQPDPNFAQPPLEGYYSPDRTSGNFSQGFISGQRSPRLAPQDLGVSGRSQHHYSPSPPQQRTLQPWQSDPNSWNVNNQATPPQYPNSTSSSYPYPNYTSTHEPRLNHRDHDGFSHTRGISSIGISPTTNSSWIRSAERRSTSNPTNPSQPTSSPSSAPHRTSRGPLKSSMKKPQPQAQGYHEVQAEPISRSISPSNTPPPPPPKDEWLTQPTQSSRPSQHSRAKSSSVSPYPRRSEDSPSRTPAANRQSLPAIQTRMTFNNNTSAQNSTFGTGTRNTTATATTPEELRKARQRQIELGDSSPSPGTGAGTSERSEGKTKIGKEAEAEDEKIVMSSSSYPGMEWQPEGAGGYSYSAWEGGGGGR